MGAYRRGSTYSDIPHTLTGGKNGQNESLLHAGKMNPYNEGWIPKTARNKVHEYDVEYKNKPQKGSFTWTQERHKECTMDVSLTMSRQTTEQNNVDHVDSLFCTDRSMCV